MLSTAKIALNCAEISLFHLNPSYISPSMDMKLVLVREGIYDSILSVCNIINHLSVFGLETKMGMVG